LGEIGAQQAEIAFDSVSAADHDMVGAGQAMRRDKLSGESAEAPLHAVADDGPADLLGDRETDPLGRVAVLPVADEQDESGRRRAPAGVRSEEVLAFADRD
jgi:hypothetical protein